MTSDSSDSNPAISEFEDAPAYQPEMREHVVNLGGMKARCSAGAGAHAEGRPETDINFTTFEQYLAFIRELQDLKLEVAADYLVGGVACLFEIATFAAATA